MNGLQGRGDAQTREMLADSAERLLAGLCTPALLRQVDLEGAGRAAQPAGAAGAAQGLWQALEDAGLPLATAPEEAGGVGLGWCDVEPLVRLAGRFGAPVPLAEMLAAHALARLAGVELPEGVATLGVVQRDADGSALVAGEVPFASAARWVLVSVPDEAAGGAHRLLVLERAAASAQRSTNPAGEERARLAWDAPEPAVSGLLPEGASVLLAGAAIRAAQLAGACAQVLEMSTRYANDRIQFGRPIGKFQAIQQQLALAGSWTALAAIASQLALADTAVGLDPTRVASAKHVAASAAELCTGIAHGVHGAIGVTEEYDLQLYSRRLHAWAGEFGSALHWSRRLGEATLAGTQARCWDGIISATSI